MLSLAARARQLAARGMAGVNLWMLVNLWANGCGMSGYYWF